jgi:hypothetical protein
MESLDFGKTICDRQNTSLQDIKTSANPVFLAIMRVTAREYKCDDRNIV